VDSKTQNAAAISRNPRGFLLGHGTCGKRLSTPWRKG